MPRHHAQALHFGKRVDQLLGQPARQRFALFAALGVRKRQHHDRPPSSFLCWFHATDAKRRRITALRILDHQRVRKSFGLVVALQLHAQPARFHANNRVEPGIVFLPPVEHLHADHEFLQLIAMPVERLADRKLQEPRQPARPRHRTAGDDLARLGADRLRCHVILDARNALRTHRRTVIFGPYPAHEDTI